MWCITINDSVNVTAEMVRLEENRNESAVVEELGYTSGNTSWKQTQTHLWLFTCRIHWLTCFWVDASKYRNLRKLMIQRQKPAWNGWLSLILNKLFCHLKILVFPLLVLTSVQTQTCTGLWVHFEVIKTRSAEDIYHSYWDQGASVQQGEGSTQPRLSVVDYFIWQTEMFC